MFPFVVRVANEREVPFQKPTYNQTRHYPGELLPGGHLFKKCQKRIHFNLLVKSKIRICRVIFARPTATDIGLSPWSSIFDLTMANVDEFVASLPRSERVITQALRSIIMDSDPRIAEKLSYGVPYFSIRRRICFVWPASAPYGPKVGKVSLGMCFGYLISDHDKMLQMDGRMQVSVARFGSLSEIDERKINEIMQEAILVDNMKLKRK